MFEISKYYKIEFFFYYFNIIPKYFYYHIKVKTFIIYAVLFFQKGITNFDNISKK